MRKKGNYNNKKEESKEPEKVYSAVCSKDIVSFSSLEMDTLRKNTAKNSRVLKASIQEVFNKYLRGELEGCSFETDFISAKSEGRMQILLSLMPYITQRFDTETINEEKGITESTTHAIIEVDGVAIKL